MTHKAILEKWTEYNQRTNGDLVKILRTLDEGKLEEPNGSYFTTLANILNHLMTADVVWFRRFRDHGFWPRSEEKSLVVFPETNYKTKLFTTLEEFIPLRTDLDRLWFAFAESLQEEVLDQEFVYTTIQGAKIKISIGGAILHLMNHQTHHRGAISQILDSWGVPNDYSGLNKTFGSPV